MRGAQQTRSCKVIAIAISTDANKVLASGAILEDRRKVITVAPAKPPTLKRAWKPDISG